MPEAAKNYSITELEMCGLAMNIATFLHLLKKVDFDAIVDHLAIMHIMRSKAEPATTRIKRLLELLSPHSFNLYYIKGKDKVLSDFLSGKKTVDSNPHELIPISFSLRDQVSDYFYHIGNEVIVPREDKYLVQTRSQVRSSGIRLPEIHGANKGLNPHIQPGKQKSFPIQTINKGTPTHPIPKPRVGQGRAGLRRKVKGPQPITLPHLLPAQPITEHDSRPVVPLPEPINQLQSHVQSQILPRPLSQHHPIDPIHIPQQIGPKIQHRPTPSYHDPYTRPPPKPPDISNPLDIQKDLLDNDLDRKVEIEENLPFQEDIILEIYERPDNSYVQEPQEFRMKRLALLNKDGDDFQYNSSDLVYIISPLTSQLRTASRKVSIKYIGPVAVYKIVDPHNYLLMTLDGKLLRGLFEYERLKPAVIRTNQGNVTNLSKLKQVMSS